MNFASSLTPHLDIGLDEHIQTLYSLTRVTFNSHRISRSLIRVLTAAELYEEAHLALNLYIQLVDKAREAEAADESNGEQAQGNGQANGSAKAIEQDKGMKDIDDTETYLRTLAFGIRMLCRYLNAAGEAERLGRKALEIAQGDKKFARSGHAQQSVLALLKRVSGVARASYAVSEGSPLNRTQLQTEALQLLQDSVALDNQAAESYYHLAFLQAEMRDVAGATVSARRAVELEPASLESWHLLTLLLSSRKEYKAALQLAEVALDEAEKDDEADKDLATDGINTHATVNGVSNGLPIVRSALLSYDFPPRANERAEAMLRLLITHNALEEIVEGVEVAIEEQKQLFAFFHERIATEATARIARAGNAVLPKAAVQAQTPSADEKRGSRLSTLLHIHSHSHNAKKSAQRRFGTATGLGQSGASSARTASLAAASKPFAAGTRGGLSNALPPPASEAVAIPEGDDSPETERLRLHLKQEADLLASIWLLSAATFRRAGKLGECRVAIQEAERIAPANPNVWLQLALWFVEGDNIALATSSLYKALACQSDHVASAVHLARIFLSSPDSIPATSPNTSLFSQSAATPTPVPRPGVQHEFLDGTQSRSIGASPKSTSRAPGGTDAKFDSAAEATASRESKKLTALSLAEGLLNTATAAGGWDVPEAWLFLGHVAQKTNRQERAAECLKYALTLEETKSIRYLGHAVLRAA